MPQSDKMVACRGVYLPLIRIAPPTQPYRPTPSILPEFSGHASIADPLHQPDRGQR